MNRKALIFGGLVALAAGLAIALPLIPPEWITVSLWVDVSSILTLISFSLKNVLMLRILAVAAEITFIPYALFQPTPLWEPIIWNFVFMAINLYQIVLLLLERRPVKFNADEQKLYDLKFNTLQPREFVKLLTVAQWKTGKAGEKIIEHGSEPTEIYVLSDGTVRVSADGKQWYTIEPGDLLGTTSALLGEPYCFNAECVEDSKYVYFPLEPVRKLIDKNPELRQKITNLENRDFATHLRQFEMLVMKSGKAPEEAQKMVEAVTKNVQKSAEPSPDNGPKD